MKASELRLGNLIEKKYANFRAEGHYWSVAPVNASDLVDFQQDDNSAGVVAIHPIDFFPDNYKPVPLTEEWLLKLGAKKEVLDAGSGIGFYDSYSIGNYELSRVFTNMWGIIGIECEPMNYVHQLQNLYFALTTQELTITPNP